MFRLSTYRRTFASLALALACCAAIVPAASAMIPDRHHGTTQEGPAEAVRPINPGAYTNDWPGSSDFGYYTHDVGATASDVVAAADDGLVSRPAPADNVADQPTPVSAPNSGFDWSDAGIGIAIGIFAAMLLGGLLLLGRRRHTLAGA
jgi:hypothetical protein